MTRRGPSSPDLILAAARREFSAHGLAGARTDAIARRAGVNKQLLHYYFKTKASLYHAALERAAADLANDLGRIPLVGLTAVERLRRLIRGQFDLLAEHEEVTRLLVRSDGDGTWVGTAVTPVARLLTEGQATGFFRDDVDPLLHARQALLLHLGYFALLPVTSTWGPRTLWRDRVTELLVKGCTW